MKRNCLIFAILYLLVSCKSVPAGFKELDVKAFEITVPETWAYEDPGDVGDSFGGQITGPTVLLNFEYSAAGYASNLMQTENDFLSSGGWREACHFCQKDVTYTDSANVTALKQSEMNMKHIKDPSLVKVEPYPVEKVERIHVPSKEQKKLFPYADFVADISNKDSVKSIPLMVPMVIKQHNIIVDSTDKYVIKTIWPKKPGRGMTGVYIKSRTSRFNFQMNGVDLSAADQKLALAAFKTITFKK